MPSIIIQDILPRVQEVVSGMPQTTFSFPFPIFAEQDLSVFQRLASAAPNDVGQILTLTNDYTVTGVGNPNGGSVTLNNAAAVGSIITIVRTMADQRLNCYINTAITADALNTDFESDVMMIQQNTLYNTQITPHYNLNAVIVPVVDTILPILTANQIWAKNDDDTAIIGVTLPNFPVGIHGLGVVDHIPTFYDPTTIQNSPGIIDQSGNMSGILTAKIGSLRLSGSTIDVLVSQTAHGFTVGDVLLSTGSGYDLATADNAIDAEVTAYVNEVVDANSFYAITINGTIITGLSGLVAGSTYFLDATTPGAVTITEPSIAGQISKPVYNALSSTTAAFINMRGKIIPESSLPQLTWLKVISSTPLVVSKGFWADSASPLSFSLPAAAVAGSEFRVVGIASGGWTITQGAGQQIRYGNTQTTSGAGGSIASTAIGDSIHLVCDTANTHFTVVDAPIGVLAVV